MQITLNNWYFEAPFGSTDRHVIDARNQIVLDVGAGSDQIARFVAESLNARIPKRGAGLVVGGCRSCSAPIVWAVHFETGKKMPIDADPSWIGDLILDGGAGTWRKAVIVEAPGFRWISHFATCPNAADWRKQ